MFNNANVIFRTKFVDGVSTVSRTIGLGANSRPRSALTNRGSDSSNELAKRRKGHHGPGKENDVEA
jgi:structural maintenance of chromosome 2